MEEIINLLLNVWGVCALVALPCIFYGGTGAEEEKISLDSMPLVRSILTVIVGIAVLPIMIFFVLLCTFPLWVPIVLAIVIYLTP